MSDDIAIYHDGDAWRIIGFCGEGPMTGIYSSLPPAHELPREPINALRARLGLRPLCFNRPDFPPPMSPDCKAWAGKDTENPAEDSIPAREGWRCWGCRHLPQDPRIVDKAAALEGVCPSQTQET